MAGEKFIALEETSQEIKASVDNVKSNVDGLKNTDVPAIDTLVDEVLKRIGLTGDTGGSANLGSIMAKLNTLLTEIQNGVSGDNFSTTGFGKTIYTDNSMREFSRLNTNDYALCKFITPVSGVYNLKLKIKNQYQNDTTGKYASSFTFRVLRSSDDINIDTSTGYIIKSNEHMLIYDKAILGEPMEELSAKAKDILSKNSYKTDRLKSNGQFHEQNIKFYADKNEMIIVTNENPRDTPKHSIQNIVITYGNK